MEMIKSVRSVISHLKDGGILVEDTQSISNHVTSYFSNLFGVTDAILVFPNLVNEYMSNMLTICPSSEENIVALLI